MYLYFESNFFQVIDQDQRSHLILHLWTLKNKLDLKVAKERHSYCMHMPMTYNARSPNVVHQIQISFCSHW